MNVNSLQLLAMNLYNLKNYIFQLVGLLVIIHKILPKTNGKQYIVAYS